MRSDFSGGTFYIHTSRTYTHTHLLLRGPYPMEKHGRLRSIMAAGPGCAVMCNLEKDRHICMVQVAN